MARGGSRFDLQSIGGSLDEYAEGAILYIYLEDFVTYDRCEVYPGPYMNMVMGPNGTGKSSIVAAMALGLGWHPSVLGRSKEIGEFVKYGRDSAVVEIALHAAQLVDLVALHSENTDTPTVRPDGVLLLRRRITRSRNRSTTRHTSEWFVNDAPCSARLVAHIMRHLNVQVDNLCQFLPQDKVSEFAHLSPAELLVETEKAAAPKEVYEQHLQLGEWREKQKTLAAQGEENARRMASLEKQNENVEGLIKRIQQHEQHMHAVRLCERKRPWLLYNEARSAYLDAKRVRDETRATLERAETSTEPVKRSLRQAQTLLAQTSLKSAAMTRLADDLAAKMDRLVQDDLESLSTEISTTRAQILRLREQRARHDASIAELQRTVRMLEEELCGAPVPPADGQDADLLRGALNKVIRSLAELENDLNEIDEQVRQIGREGDRINQNVDQCNAELRQLEDVRAQRLEGVQRMSPDAFSAYQWIQAHKSLFREPVYGPICLEANVKDATLARHVESLISRTLLLNFVVTNYEDYETFNHNICTQNHWKANVTIIEDVDYNSGRAVLDQGELVRMGFLGTVLDFINAPPPVLAALIDIARIHLIPIAKTPIEHAHIEASRRIQKYAAADGFYEIRRSAYSEETAVRCTPLKNAIFFGHSSSEERKRGLIQHITEHRAELARNQNRMKSLIQDQQSLSQRVAQLKEERDVINQQRREFLAAAAEWKRKQQTLELKLGNLQKSIAQRDEYAASSEEDELKAKLRALYSKHAVHAQDGAKMLSEFRAIMDSIATDSLAVASIEGKVLRLEGELQAAEACYEDLRKALAEADSNLALSKRTAKELLDQANQQESLDEQTKEAFAELPETLEELDRLLALEKARADVVEDSALGASTISEYESRKLQIQQLQTASSEIATTLAELQRDMASLHDQWVPALESLVSCVSERFSSFFAQMSCAGEVCLSRKGNDYREWELEILVKFRDEESLQVLSAQRQSGGEKSVATILFLLSLQEFAKSPFRVVDEINQGMDAQNERRVHALIVETATRAARSQYRYFLSPATLNA